MSRFPSFAELAELDMGLFACAALIVVSLGAAMASIVIERAWLALRRLWKLWKGRTNGR
ncbi:TPA: hypothetical protein UMT99_001001 [Stenotrophomonas maltophilia]|uniref:hypothetical protein n=1 Tax=Stenotrophomonas TaxID=40323 RepID=UPI0013115BF6|nr:MULTISPECIES: hypothetical protein [Stenotrophomonas]ELC7320572.1 hypothetical protein [Stenotrophomonas maltophilia]MBH1659655.1 hypothetical protein [Stenotrophomonas maltophilia]MBH1731672.1 hypothetical protein [Stenotrophomonas maltophilia]MBH1766917.1 hypothetical protein [Stenotrophomonas maltophilia]HEL3246422.1 hypothetical protein [Stenotrophomonas maltophilia]